MQEQWHTIDLLPVASAEAHYEWHCGAHVGHEVAARISSLSQPDHALVQLSVVDIVDEGKAEVKLAAVPLSDRISSYEANENIVEITTQRYSPRPMILQGPGAGAEITASGLFADLLKLSRTLIEWNIPQII